MPTVKHVSVFVLVGGSVLWKVCRVVRFSVLYGGGGA